MILEVIKEQEVLGKDFKVYGDFENPLFLAKDIANWIEHSDTSKMVRNIDEDEKVKNIVRTLGGDQRMLFLTEDGLYEILMQSRKRIAKSFKKEVKKILKEIRRTGGYVHENRAIDFVNNWLPQLDDTSKNVISGMLEENRNLRMEIESNKPLVEYANQVASSSDSVDMGTFAKLIYDEDIKLGRNKLFKLLRDKGVLQKDNEPYQRHVDSGYFKLIPVTFETPYGIKVGKKVLVTGKGQIKLVSKLKEWVNS